MSDNIQQFYHINTTIFEYNSKLHPKCFQFNANTHTLHTHNIKRVL